MLNELYLKAFKRLPERFRKPTNKNLYYVLYGGYDETEMAFEAIRNSRNIDIAAGEVLDLLGANVGQFRQGEDDERYRLLIKIRIIANMSIGDIETINKVMSVLEGEDYRGLQEVYLIEDLDNEPAAIKVDIAWLKPSYPFDVIRRIKAGGVRIIFGVRKYQTIYFGLYGQKAKRITSFVYKPGDRESEQSLYYGIYQTHKSVIRRAVKIDVWTVDDLGMFTSLERGEDLKYGD